LQTTTVLRREIASISPRLLTIKQAARYLGYSSSELMKNIPVRPIHLVAEGLGKAARYDRSAIDAWLDGLSPHRAMNSTAPSPPLDGQTAFDQWEAGRAALNC